MNEDYIGNIITGHVLREVQSVKANVQYTKSQLKTLAEQLRRVERDRDTYRKSLRKQRRRLTEDIRASQLNRTVADLRDARMLKSELNQTNDDLCDTKRKVIGLTEDFIALNTSCVTMRSKVESCMDDLQEIQLRLPTDIQSLTTQLNQTKEDLLDTKEVISGLSEDFIALNRSCGMRKEVKPSEGNESSLTTSSLSQMSLTTSTTTFPGTTAASTDPSPSNTASLAPVKTQNSDLHATPSPAAGRRLYSASGAGDLETVKRILAAGHVDINTRGYYSRTPVMVAARRGHSVVVEFLVGRGADVSLVDRGGNNVLHLACIVGDLETVKLIVSWNVVGINARSNKGRTAVWWARHWGHQRVVEFMESRGGH
ncbi:ankyrin repeat and KH domain-containing protein 1-like isoform X2 [Haliotis rubra]|uniref:ankyrin repeat and KH domain-containing protein 1-like isoform X2 n=1 Tax=Haliotis rubra TaxID=36100 RepID=UPI001EE53965|nr:ankyrin repeat and KH domain-containing protein 1-like isoform X2 [Haliotis rubra]